MSHKKGKDPHIDAEEPVNSEQQEQRPRRLVSLANTAGDSSDTCRTFVFKEESHTLGNALKNVILQNPKVTFCGYSIPHPAEDQMLLRIQTVSGYTADEALRQGLKDLKTTCGVVKKKFESAISHFA